MSDEMRQEIERLKNTLSDHERRITDLQNRMPDSIQDKILNMVPPVDEAEAARREAMNKK